MTSLQSLGEAAIAADHTGDQNPIADLLQALDKRRDYDYSLRNLRLLLDGAALDQEAQAALATRHARREKAAELVQSGVFSEHDDITWAILDDAVDGEFFPSLLPDAVVIVMFIPRAGDTGKWNAKFRLGSAAPADFSLEQLIKPTDAGYGGRWNAGSNNRAGGSTLPPHEYVAALTGSSADVVQRV